MSDWADDMDRNDDEQALAHGLPLPDYPPDREAIRLTYTQHTVAFPTVALRERHHIDELSVSLSPSGGGSAGEFAIYFVQFSNPSGPAVGVSVFGDALACFFDPRVERAFRSWRNHKPDPDKATPADWIGWLEHEGAVASRYHKDGLERRRYVHGEG